MPLFGTNFGTMARSMQDPEEIRRRLFAMQQGDEEAQPGAQIPPMPEGQPAAPGGGQGPPMPQPQPGGYGTGQVNYSQLVGIPGATPAPGQINQFGRPVGSPGGAAAPANPLAAQTPQFNRGNAAQLLNMFMPQGMGFQPGQRMNAGGTDVVNDDWNNARMFGASPETPAFNQMAQQLSLFGPQIQAGMQALGQDPRIASEMQQHLGRLGLEGARLFGTGGELESNRIRNQIAQERNAFEISPQGQARQAMTNWMTEQARLGRNPTAGEIQSQQQRYNGLFGVNGGGTGDQGQGQGGPPGMPGGTRPPEIPQSVRDSWENITRNFKKADGSLDKSKMNEILAAFFNVNPVTNANTHNMLRHFLLNETSGSVGQPELNEWLTGTNSVIGANNATRQQILRNQGDTNLERPLGATNLFGRFGRGLGRIGSTLFGEPTPIGGPRPLGGR